MIHNVEALIYGSVNNCIIITIILLFTMDNVWLAAISEKKTKYDEQVIKWHVP